MNILTIVVLAIILLSALIGYKKGAIKVLFSIFSLIITLVIASIVSPIVSGALQNTNVYESIYKTTYQYVNEKIVENASQSLESAMDAMELPESIQKMIKLDQKIGQTQFEISGVIAAKLSQYILDVISFVATMIVAMIAMKILGMALNIVSLLPVIGDANRLLGLAIGIAEGVIIVWIFFVILTLFGNSDFAISMYQQINESEILKLLYNNNIIMKMLFK